MKIRLFAGLAAAAIMAFFTSGCGDGKKIETKKTVNLTYWQHSSQARDKVVQELVDKFMAENSDIKVSLEFIPELDYSTKLISSLAANSGPDIFQVQAGMFGRLVKAGSIQPLDPSIIPYSSIESEFVPATIEGLKIDGKFYGLPTDVQTIVLYWNKKLLRDAGFDAEKGPQNWEDMKNWAVKMTKFENGRMSMSGWGEKGYNPEVMSLVAQYGGKVVNEKGEFIYADDPKSVEAIKFMVDVYRKDKVFSLQFMLSAWPGFRVGKVAMMLGHPAMFGNFKTTAPNLELGVGLIPAYNGKRTTAVTSWGYAVTTKADPSSAAKFVKFMTSEESQRKWINDTGELPSRKTLLDDPKYQADPVLSVMGNSLKDSVVSYMQLSSINSIWIKGYEEMTMTDKPFEQLLHETQKLMNEDIKKK